MRTSITTSTGVRTAAKRITKGAGTVDANAHSEDGALREVGDKEGDLTGDEQDWDVESSAKFLASNPWENLAELRKFRSYF